MSIVHRYNKKMSSLGIIFWANFQSGVWKFSPQSFWGDHLYSVELLSLTCSCVEVWSPESICPPWRKPVWSPQWGALVSGHPLQGPWTRKPGHVQQLSPDSPAGPQNQGGCKEVNQCMLFTLRGSGVVSIPLGTYLGLGAYLVKADPFFWFSWKVGVGPLLLNQLVPKAGSRRNLAMEDSVGEGCPIFNASWNSYLLSILSPYSTIKGPDLVQCARTKYPFIIPNFSYKMHEKFTVWFLMGSVWTSPSSLAASVPGSFPVASMHITL